MPQWEVKLFQVLNNINNHILNIALHMENQTDHWYRDSDIDWIRLTKRES